jgi:hypothetical protein
MQQAITTEEKLWWMSYALRTSIDRDWARLALEPLASNERRTTTKRLIAATKALEDIKNIQRMRLA